MSIGPGLAGIMGLLGGGGGGAPPQAPGGLGANPEQSLEALSTLQQQPPPAGEQEALRDASMKISMAMNRVATRSAKGAKLLAEALAKIQAARETIDAEPSRPMGAPPNLMGQPGQGPPMAPPPNPAMGMGV